MKNLSGILPKLALTVAVPNFFWPEIVGIHTGGFFETTGVFLATNALAIIPFVTISIFTYGGLDETRQKISELKNTPAETILECLLFVMQVISFRFACFLFPTSVQVDTWNAAILGILCAKGLAHYLSQIGSKSSTNLV